MTKEYYVSLEEQVQLGMREATEIEQPTAIPVKRARHSWTGAENAVIYMVWSLEANKPNANYKHLAGGQAKHEMGHMIQKVRELATEQFKEVSDGAIICQLSRCGYTLLNANNNFPSKKAEQMFIDLHRSLKIWNEQATLDKTE